MYFLKLLHSLESMRDRSGGGGKAAETKSMLTSNPEDTFADQINALQKVGLLLQSSPSLDL